MEISRVNYTPSLHLPLLLMGDEHLPMIERYIGRATIFTATAHGLTAGICAITHEADGSVEIQNLAVLPQERCKGIGRALLRHVERTLRPGTTIYLATGETPSTLRFYRNCGYTYSHTVPDHFTTHYPTPIVEDGVTLRHQIHLRKTVPFREWD